MFIYLFLFCFAVRDSHPSASQELRWKPEVAEAFVRAEQVCLTTVIMCELRPNLKRALIEMSVRRRLLVKQQLKVELQPQFPQGALKILAM